MTTKQAISLAIVILESIPIETIEDMVVDIMELDDGEVHEMLLAFRRTYDTEDLLVDAEFGDSLPALEVLEERLLVSEHVRGCASVAGQDCDCLHGRIKEVIEKKKKEE